MNRRPLRIQRSNDVFMCSNRCHQNAELIPTDPLATARIHGALGYYADIHEIDLYAYSFLPHGFWLVMGSKEASRQNFMRDFQSWLATWVNRRLERTGSLFHQRYDDEAILDMPTLIQCCVDAIVAPVREGFAEELDHYSGATSWEWVDTGRAPRGTWVNRAKFHSLKRSNPNLTPQDVAEDVEVELKEPPVESYVGDDSLDDREAVEWVARQIMRRVQRITEWQSQLSDEQLVERRSTPHEEPKKADPREPIGPPRYRYDWLCRVQSEELRKRYRTFRLKMRLRYEKASALWREGKEAFCGCCGGEESADEALEELAADGGECDCGKDDGGSSEKEGEETSSCGNEVDYPGSSIPPGWVKTRKPLKLRMKPTPGRAG